MLSDVKVEFLIQEAVLPNCNSSDEKILRMMIAKTNNRKRWVACSTDNVSVKYPSKFASILMHAI